MLAESALVRSVVMHGAHNDELLCYTGRGRTFATLIRQARSVKSSWFSFANLFSFISPVLIVAHQHVYP